ncbi:MAG: acyl-ACP--UDP-N-acetylglucosamine O-acyltransferase [Candidatus Aureabacteria bacterium]|nr:acyl-ACP--UDP-N-acetylglucosamine O-acyltransferase [Candidatus Auribacterota bacterium]
MIHPTALIDPKAHIETDVLIGPHVVIGPDVQIHKGVSIHHHASIIGNTVIEKDVQIHSFASIGDIPQDLKYKKEKCYCNVGERTVIREFATINAGVENQGPITQIGSDCLMMAYSHLGHNTIVGNHVVIANSGTLAGHVKVDDYAIIGGLVGVHQFVHIGTLTIVGGCSKVNKDLPPFMLADGIPARIHYINKVGLKRKGYDPEVISKIKETFILLYRSGLNVSQALEKLVPLSNKCSEVKAVVQFIKDSERGIARGTFYEKSGTHCGEW